MNKKELILAQVEEFKRMQSWDIYRLSKMLGVKIYLSDMSSPEELKYKSLLSDDHFLKTKSGKAIILNSCYDVISARFSVAYHLAEYILGKQDSFLTVNQDYEPEVYDYAVDLLVPDHFDFQTGDIEKMAEKYHVTTEVILHKQDLLLNQNEKTKTKSIGRLKANVE